MLLNEQRKDGMASVLYDARVAVVKCAFSTWFPLSKGQFTAMAMFVRFAKCKHPRVKYSLLKKSSPLTCLWMV